MAKRERKVAAETVAVEVVGSVKFDGAIVPVGERIVVSADEAARLVVRGHVRVIHNDDGAAGVHGEEGADAG